MICTRCTSHYTEFCAAGFSLGPSTGVGSRVLSPALCNSELPQGTLPGSTLGDLGFSSLGHCRGASGTYDWTKKVDSMVASDIWIAAQHHAI